MATMKYIQAGIRRNGLHAIRGWLCNQLKLVDMPYDPVKFDPEGTSWFSYTIKQYTVDEILSQPYKYITIESYPLDQVLQVAKNNILILHIRSLLNWVASSYTITLARDGDANLRMHKECIDRWRKYVEYAQRIQFATLNTIIIWYDNWATQTLYRQRIAKQLGIEYDGSPYNTVHGIEYSSFDGKKFEHDADKMDVNNRYKHLLNNSEFMGLVCPSII